MQMYTPSVVWSTYHCGVGNLGFDHLEGEENYHGDFGENTDRKFMNNFPTSLSMARRVDGGARTDNNNKMTG